MSVKTSIQKLGLEKIFDYVYRDPDKSLVLMNLNHNEK